MIEAVLFDFDGVIANTLIYHARAWQIVFRPYHIKITPEDIAIEEGAKALEIAHKIVEKKKLGLSSEKTQQLTDEKHRLYPQITKASIYPEIKDFIKKLKLKPLKLGLVTGSITSAMQTVVGKNFFQNFQVVITSDDVKKCKPDPESYLVAANKLQIPPTNCLVIENAPLGIRAAKSAGMICAAVRTTIQNDHLLKNADLIVNNVSEINIDSILKASTHLKSFVYL